LSFFEKASSLAVPPLAQRATIFFLLSRFFPSLGLPLSFFYAAGDVFSRLGPRGSWAPPCRLSPVFPSPSPAFFCFPFLENLRFLTDWRGLLFLNSESLPERQRAFLFPDQRSPFSPPIVPFSLAWPLCTGTLPSGRTAIFPLFFYSDPLQGGPYRFSPPPYSLIEDPPPGFHRSRAGTRPSMTVLSNSTTKNRFPLFCKRTFPLLYGPLSFFPASSLHGIRTYVVAAPLPGKNLLFSPPRASSFFFPLHGSDLFWPFQAAHFNAEVPPP